MDSWLVTCPNWARASSVLVGMGFARATPPMADNASATAIESVSFEDMLASFLAGSVPAHRFVLHQFAASFMGFSLRAGVATPRAGSDRETSAVDERRKK